MIRNYLDNSERGTMRILFHDFARDCFFEADEPVLFMLCSELYAGTCEICNWSTIKFNLTLQMLLKNL